jgi:hypothetical protein
MKKLLVILALVLLPVCAFAGMSAITDSEMESVTGQMGVSIAVLDSQQDLSIANIAFGIENTGTIAVYGQTVGMAPGYINISNIAINKLTQTLNGFSDGAGNLFGQPLKIDVAYVSAANSPFVALRDKTAVIIQMADQITTIDSITIGAIELTSTLATNPVAKYAQASVAGALVASVQFNPGSGTNTTFYSVINAGGHYAYSYTAGASGNDQLIGNIRISGLQQVSYSSLEGFSTSGAKCPARKSLIAIFPHNVSGK